MNHMTVIHRDTLSCEPILRRMPNGELLCVSQCGDVTEPAPGNRVVVFHSADEGKSWSGPTLIIPDTGEAVYLTEVTVFRDRVVVYLTLHNGAFLNWRSQRVESRDCGYTWQTLGPLEGEETFSFPRGAIRLPDGRYMMASQHYPVTALENARLVQRGARWLDADIDRVENRVLVSSDEGATWRRLGQVDIPMKGNTGRRWVWSEPTILDLRDGRIAMLLRVCGSGRLFYAESSDGGMHFTNPIPTDIPNPGNKPKLIRLADGRIALIHTPNATLGFAGRNPLSIWLSRDEMKSFPDRREICCFPGAFCYPDGFSEGNHIRFAIEFNRKDILYVDADVSEGGAAT